MHCPRCRGIGWSVGEGFLDTGHLRSWEGKGGLESPREAGGWGGPKSEMAIENPQCTCRKGSTVEGGWTVKKTVWPCNIED